MSTTDAKPLASFNEPAAAGLNKQFARLAPIDIVRWALASAERPILTTNFRPLSIALVHLVSRVNPDLPIIWIDTGFNTSATKQFVEDVRARLALNLHVYKPLPVCATAISQDPPPIDSSAHQEFTRRVKLEPFERALATWRPDYWLTGIRAEQTKFRRGLGVVSRGPHGAIRVAPFYHWREIDLEGYLYDNDLSDYDDYFDPTKGPADRECGLQTLGTA